MSSSKVRKGESIDTEVSPKESAPRLQLSRETVKSLRVRSGCQTGYILNNVGAQPSIQTKVLGFCH